MEMEAGAENVTMLGGHETDDSIVQLSDLSEFVSKKVLSRSLGSKSIYLEGTFSNKTGSAVLLLEKEPFNEDDLKALFSNENKQEKVFQNDIYSYFRSLPVSVCNGIKITSIFPATEKHIKKYTYQPVHMVDESPHLYRTVTLPCLQAEQFSLAWVYNILEHKSEVERIVFEDNDPEVGFVLLPDLKWDGVTVESLYLLALPMKRGILSLRDLTDKELPLLNNIYKKGLKAIEEKYLVPPSRLRVYFHYQPSFYHLHVHFTYIQAAIPECGSDRFHLMSTVISNISLLPNYYQLATIPFSVKQSDILFTKYEEAGIVKRVQEV